MPIYHVNARLQRNRENYLYSVCLIYHSLSASKYSFWNMNKTLIRGIYIYYSIETKTGIFYVGAWNHFLVFVRKENSVLLWRDEIVWNLEELFFEELDSKTCLHLFFLLFSFLIHQELHKTKISIQKTMKVRWLRWKYVKETISTPRSTFQKAPSCVDLCHEEKIESFLESSLQAQTLVSQRA